MAQAAFSTSSVFQRAKNKESRRIFRRISEVEDIACNIENEDGEGESEGKSEGKSEGDSEWIIRKYYDTDPSAAEREFVRDYSINTQRDVYNGVMECEMFLLSWRTRMWSDEARLTNLLLQDYEGLLPAIAKYGFQHTVKVLLHLRDKGYFNFNKNEARVILKPFDDVSASFIRHSKLAKYFIHNSTMVEYVVYLSAETEESVLNITADSLRGLCAGYALLTEDFHFDIRRKAPEWAQLVSDGDKVLEINLRTWVKIFKSIMYPRGWLRVRFDRNSELGFFGDRDDAEWYRANAITTNFLEGLAAYTERKAPRRISCEDIILTIRAVQALAKPMKIETISEELALIVARLEHLKKLLQETLRGMQSNFDQDPETWKETVDRIKTCREKQITESNPDPLYWKGEEMNEIIEQAIAQGDFTNRARWEKYLMEKIQNLDQETPDQIEKEERKKNPGRAAQERGRSETYPEPNEENGDMGRGHYGNVQKVRGRSDDSQGRYNNSGEERSFNSNNQGRFNSNRENPGYGHRRYEGSQNLDRNSGQSFRGRDTNRFGSDNNRDGFSSAGGQRRYDNSQDSDRNSTQSYRGNSRYRSDNNRENSGYTPRTFDDSQDSDVGPSPSYQGNSGLRSNNSRGRYQAQTGTSRYNSGPSTYQSRRGRYNNSRGRSGTARGGYSNSRGGYNSSKGGYNDRSEESSDGSQGRYRNSFQERSGDSERRPETPRGGYGRGRGGHNNGSTRGGGYRGNTRGGGYRGSTRGEYSRDAGRGGNMSSSDRSSGYGRQGFGVRGDGGRYDNDRNVDRSGEREAYWSAG